MNPGFASDTVPISLTVTRPNGCSATDLATLFVRRLTPPSSRMPTAVCPSPWPRLPRALDVQWDFGDLNNPNVPGATAHFTEPGTYTVVADGISVFGCAGSDTSTVVVYPTPPA